MLEGRTVVFLSCMHEFKDRLARPIRDGLNDLGYRAVIVEDEPLLRGSFDRESKVSAYIEASDAFVALCTHDERVPGGTAQNITEEIARARSHPKLRDVVCVLKEANVTLPANITPVYEPLDRDRPDAALGVIRIQLNAWGVIPTESGADPDVSTPLRAEFIEQLFEGIQLGEHEKAEDRLRRLFAHITKNDQVRVAQTIFNRLLAAPADGNEVHVAASFLEACSRLDPSLVPMEWVERLAHSQIVQHRMSAAMTLWDLAETLPGVVPIDLLVRLAKPSTEDWYVYAPALEAAKQLALTRKSAVRIIGDLGHSVSAEDRHAAIGAFEDLARVDPLLIPDEMVAPLANDSDEAVAGAAHALLAVLRGITEEERRFRYGKFGL